MKLGRWGFEKMESIRKIVIIKTMKEMLENETFSVPTSLVSIIKNYNFKNKIKNQSRRYEKCYVYAQKSKIFGMLENCKFSAHRKCFAFLSVLEIRVGFLRFSGPTRTRRNLATIIT
ncbi:MAG: hypothetical protein IH934_07575 [Nanoarchaeota archaeon]|nr:hypothetical protein [Nanoarchaeota archaeon]